MTILNTLTEEGLKEVRAIAAEGRLPVVWTEKKALAHFRAKITPKVVMQLADELLQRRQAAAEPIGYVTEIVSYNGGMPYGRIEFTKMLDPEIVLSALYTNPPAPDVPALMKDHQIRELVNQLRDIAVEYHGTQQLRENIARVVRATVLQNGATAAPGIPLISNGCNEDASEMLRRLAVIMSGSDTPGEIRSLTVTAQSLVDRCKQLARDKELLLSNSHVLCKPASPNNKDFCD